jgi:penicillin amidase
VTINTPGQSGHVSVAEFGLRTISDEADGPDVAYGPHMTDQLPLYTGLRYKDGNFQPDSGTPDKELLGARIYRDGFGVPTIYAPDLRSAWRAVGYAFSQDRMWQQHLLRMVAQGRSAELIGEDGLEMDIAQRRDFYTPAEYEGFYNSLETWEKEQLQAYAEGVNLWIAEMHSDPNKLPAEIAALAEPIEPWDALDSVALGALMARSVASDGGQELENVKLLTELVEKYGRADGETMFNDFLWPNDPGAPTSVPAEEGEFSSYPHGAPKQDALDNSIDAVLDLPASAITVGKKLTREAALKARMQEELGLPNPGSNGWVISPERSGAGAMLFNGPQVGYTVAGLLTEFEIHITDGERAVDAKGVTVAGVPFVGIGYTDTHAWGLTSGLSDTKDLYVEKLVGDTKHYEFNGSVLAMDCRSERFVVKDPTKLPDGQVPRVHTEEVCRTVHGPVIDVDAEAGVAYSQRYAIWGQEIGTLKGLIRWPYAETIEAFDHAMSQVTWNENTLYADNDGHIAYWHPGLYPARPRDFDERLPYPGTGEAEWEGFLRWKEMPHSIDPAQGWLANWNSKPSVGWTSGDPHYGDRPWGEANRLNALTAPLRAGDPIGSLPALDAQGLLTGRDGIFAPDVSGGVSDQTVDYFRPFLATAAASPSATDRQRDAIDLILDWDGSREDVNDDGKVDHAGLTIFDQWVEESAAKSIFGQYNSMLTGGGFDRGGHKWEPSPVTNMFLRALKGPDATLPQSLDYLGGRSNDEVILSTLDHALGVLTSKFGAAPLDQWLADIQTASLEVQGLGPGGKIPYQDRGSWIEVVEYPAG